MPAASPTLLFIPPGSQPHSTGPHGLWEPLKHHRETLLVRGSGPLGPRRLVRAQPSSCPLLLRPRDLPPSMSSPFPFTPSPPSLPPPTLPRELSLLFIATRWHQHTMRPLLAGAAHPTTHTHAKGPSLPLSTSAPCQRLPGLCTWRRTSSRVPVGQGWRQQPPSPSSDTCQGCHST